MHLFLSTTCAKWIAIAGITLHVAFLTSFAQRCDIQVPGEIFCDEFGPDSSQRWIRLGSSLTLSEGKGRLTGTNVPGIEPVGIGNQSGVSIQAVGQIFEGIGFGIIAREQGGFNYYVFAGELEDGQQGYALERGGNTIEDIHSGVSTFSAFDEPIAMQFDLFGDQLSYWVWPADQPRPNDPIATITDARQSSGRLYLYTGDVPFENRGTAEFDFARIATESIATYEPIPEPACQALMLVGAAAALHLRRRRHQG